MKCLDLFQAPKGRFIVAWGIAPGWIVRMIRGLKARAHHAVAMVRAFSPEICLAAEPGALPQATMAPGRWPWTRRLAKLCVTTALLLSASLAHADWQPLAPMPAGNGGFACGFLDGQLIVAGGTNWTDDTKHWLDVVWRYDPKANAWSTIGKLPQPIAYGASGIIQGKLVIAGGSDGKTALRDILALNGQGESQRVGQLAEGRIYACSTAYQDQLYIAGGATDPAELKTFTATQQRISFAADGQAAVTEGAKLGDVGFGIGTAAGAWGRVFVLGGARFDAATQVVNLDVVHVLGANEPKAQLPCAMRGLTAVPLSEHHIYLAGGYPNDETGFTDGAWIFIATTGQFVPAKALPIKAMVHLVSDGEWVYCLGGEDKKKHRSDKVWRIAARELLAPVMVK